MKGFKLFVLVASSAAAFAAVSSAIAAVPLPLGWYLEGNVGAPRVSDSNNGTNINTSTSGLGWNVNGGYKFMPYFAGEIGYTNYANTKLNFNGNQVAKDSIYSYYLAGKGILPISNSGVELFAKLGIARNNSHVNQVDAAYVAANGLNVSSGSTSNTGLYFGVGGDYSVTTNLAVNLQWDRAKGGSTIGNLDLYSIGLTYLFNQ